MKCGKGLTIKVIAAYAQPVDGKKREHTIGLAERYTPLLRAMRTAIGCIPALPVASRVKSRSIRRPIPLANGAITQHYI